MSTVEAKYRQLKVPELKELLASKGLQVSGKKEDLIARLLSAEDKKLVETINQPSKNSSNTNTTRKSSIENIINKDPAESTTLSTEVKEDNDLFDKDLTLMSATDITTGIDNDFDWDITLQKDGEFDPLISPISPSLSVTSIKDEKAKTEITEVTKGSNVNVEAKRSVETATKNPEAETTKTESSSSNSDSIVKPSGFTCKKIVFETTTASASQTQNKSQTDLATELERRKKRAERFGVKLSDSDKKLQRAARFGTTVSNPLDAPLTAPRMQKRKPSIVEDEEKLKKRAERFGLDKANNISNEEEKKRKRAERFSSNAPSNPSSIPHSSSSKSPTNSIPEINEEEEKKKRRTERFAINDTIGEPANKKVKT